MANWHCDTDIKGYDVEIPSFVRLTKHGILTVFAGYQWDGSSGPVIDRKTNMYSGLAHDAFYQLLRAGLLPQSLRAQTDHLYRELYTGWRWVGWLDYVGLRIFGGSSAKRKPEVESIPRSI